MGNSGSRWHQARDYGIYIRTSSAENVNRLARLPIRIDEWANRQVWHPAFAVNVAGTTGAGDSAYAGFLTAMLKGLSVDDAARWHVRLARAMSKLRSDQAASNHGMRHSSASMQDGNCCRSASAQRVTIQRNNYS
ncbi:MAG: PfkB family carbohydrate kinase [Anaerolineae bacterium]